MLLVVLSDFVFEVELPLVLVAFFLPTFFFPTISLPIEIESMVGTNNKQSLSLRSPITAGHTELLLSYDTIDSTWKEKVMDGRSFLVSKKALQAVWK